MRQKQDILNQLRTLKPRLQKDYGVETLGLFGSYVRNEQDSLSDIDVLVDFSRKITLFGFARLNNELSDLLGIKVDLVMRDSLKPTLGKRILSEVEYI